MTDSLTIAANCVCPTCGSRLLFHEPDACSETVLECLECGQVFTITSPYWGIWRMP